MTYQALGRLAAFSVFNVRTKHADIRVDTPYEQTYQRQAANIGPINTEGDISSTWEEHDTRMDQQRHTSEDTVHNT